MTGHDSILFVNAQGGNVALDLIQYDHTVQYCM